MDILHKLRILFWLLVLGLWGLYLYQYMQEDLNSLPKIRLSTNFIPSNLKSQKILPVKIEKKEIDKTVLTENKEQNNNIETSTNSRIFLNTHIIEDIPETKNIEELKTTNTPLTKNETYPQPPKGFAMVITKNFVVYEEAEKVSEELTKKLENLHGNIMLDLIAFSPWQRDNKVFIYYSHNPQTYQKLTGRPSWSGGAAKSDERKIYLYESEEAFGILAHELSHIYFDSFFGNPTNCPLWLSEGMAVFIQIERGGAYPRWLKDNIEILKNGGGFKLEDLVRIENLDNGDDKSIRLWYAQSYSLVLFLMRMKQGDSFYTFCKNLKEGQYISRALYNAYGKPYNKLSNLEVVWRYDLKTGKLRQLNK